jgi:hypothetical protein
MKTKNKLLFGLMVPVLAGLLLVSCKKESEGVSQTLSYPEITITGNSEITLAVGETYTEQGATARAGEQTLEVTISTDLDTSIPNIYFVNYTAEVTTDGFLLTQTVQRRVNVYAPEGVDISGNYRIVHTTRTTEMTLTKTDDRTYHASDTWWQASPIQCVFIDCGNGIFSMWPKEQNSNYGPFAGPITYDYTTNRIRFNLEFVAGVNLGAVFNWEWETQ